MLKWCQSGLFHGNEAGDIFSFRLYRIILTVTKYMKYHILLILHRMPKVSIILKFWIFDHVTYNKQKHNYKGRRIFSKMVELRNWRWKWILNEKSSNTALFFSIITFLPQNYCNLLISQSNYLKLVLDLCAVKNCWNLKLKILFDAGNLYKTIMPRFMPNYPVSCSY